MVTKNCSTSDIALLALRILDISSLPKSISTYHPSTGLAVPAFLINSGSDKAYSKLKFSSAILSLVIISF